MIVKRVSVGPLAENCYIVFREGSSGSLIIDPGDEFEKIDSIINACGVAPQAILLTHGHFDHIMSVGAIKNKYNCPVYIHEDDFRMASSGGNISYYFGENSLGIIADKIIYDDCILDISDYKIKAIHTPGHTKGSVSYYFDGMLFSGDTLFLLSCGRTDFPGGSMGAMRQSLEKLMTLPLDTIVYPGHGDESTIGFEKENNPYV